MIGGSLAQDTKNGLKCSKFSTKIVQLLLQPCYQLLCLSAFLSQEIWTRLCSEVEPEFRGKRKKNILQINHFQKPVHCAMKHRACFYQQLYKPRKNLHVV